MSSAVARIGDPFTDGDVVAQGSGDVMINGIPAARLGDFTAGHSCYPAVPIVEGSGLVMVNGLPLVRVGDAHAVHCCNNSCHAGDVSAGSPDVFAG